MDKSEFGEGRLFVIAECLGLLVPKAVPHLENWAQKNPDALIPDAMYKERGEFGYVIDETDDRIVKVKGH